MSLIYRCASMCMRMLLVRSVVGDDIGWNDLVTTNGVSLRAIHIPNMRSHKYKYPYSEAITDNIHVGSGSQYVQHTTYRHNSCFDRSSPVVFRRDLFCKSSCAYLLLGCRSWSRRLRWGGIKMRILVPFSFGWTIAYRYKGLDWDQIRYRPW